MLKARVRFHYISVSDVWKCVRHRHSVDMLYRPACDSINGKPMPEIEEVTAHPIREPGSKRTYTILRLKTRSGPTGYGECRTVSATDLAELRRIIIGKEATA